MSVCWAEHCGEMCLIGADWSGVFSGGVTDAVVRWLFTQPEREGEKRKRWSCLSYTHKCQQIINFCI